MARVKKYNIRISSKSSLVIIKRPYRSTKHGLRKARSKEKVLPTYLFLVPTKEIAFSIKKTKKRSAKADRLLKTIGPQAILPFLMILIGFSGLVYFSKQQAGNNDQGVQPTSSFSVPTSDISSSSNKDNSLQPSKPVHIRVKKVGIDAPVMEVGQNKDKTMEVPPLHKNITGWYKYSPTPGEVGPSVINGHVDTIDGPSVFYGLKDLKAGDVIEITRKDKKVVKFKVTGLEQFSQNKFPTEKVYGNIDYPGLRLITCGGSFNESTQSYTANTVVFAKMVEDKT